jgi:hypothetical protein
VQHVDQAPGAWLNMVRRMRFSGLVPGLAGRIIKAVAFDMAACADFVNGGDVRPGIARIAVECEIDYRTAKRAVAAIRNLGLIRLVRRATRRGHSDVYQLTMPEDILDRLTVLTPSEMDLAIETIRSGSRGRTTPTTPDDDPGTGHAHPRADEPARVTPVPVQEAARVTATPVRKGKRKRRTGHGVTRANPSTGHAVSQHGSRHAPPPSQSTETSTTTEPTDLGVRADLTEARASPREDSSNSADVSSGRCARHPRVAGLSGGLRPDGKPICPLCRADARSTGAGPPALRLVRGGAA